MGASRGRRIGIIIIILVLLVLVIGAVGVIAITQLGILGGGGGGGDGTANGGPIIATAGPGGEPGEGFVTPTPVPTTNIIIAARDIPRGARLAVQDVTVLAYPSSAEVPIPADVIIVTDEEGQGLEQVEGRIARTDLLAGQPVFNYQLTPGDEPTNLADIGSDTALLVPSGSVAYAIPANRFGLVGYSLRPGDHVDLLMSFRFVDVDQEFQTAFPNTGIIIDPDPEFTLSQFEYPLGRDQLGPFGSLLLITQGEPVQRSRQVTQLVVDNAIVLGVGEFDRTDLFEPIVVTQGVEQQPEEEQPQEEAPADGGEAAAEEEAPTPTPIPDPDMLTLVMDRQDALVLKYSLETGAFIDVVLRSSLDDDLNDVVTDSVTLQYLLDFYGVQTPPRLPISQSPRISAITDVELGDYLDTSVNLVDTQSSDAGTDVGDELGGIQEEQVDEAEAAAAQ